MSGLRFESMADMPPRMRELYAKQAASTAGAQQTAQSAAKTQQKYKNQKAERGAVRFDSQKEARRYDELMVFYCSQTCAAKQVAKEREGTPFAKKNFPTQTRIRITARLPVYKELQPKVGAVYDALKFEARYGGHGGYVIESGGKKINVRLDEAVEVT